MNQRRVGQHDCEVNRLPLLESVSESNPSLLSSVVQSLAASMAAIMAGRLCDPSGGGKTPYDDSVDAGSDPLWSYSTVATEFIESRAER